MKNLTPVDALALAVEKAGSQSALARQMSANNKTTEVSAARVWNWIKRGTGAPAEVCPDIEAVTGVRCEQLRPEANWAVVRKSGKTKRAVCRRAGGTE